MAINLTNKHNLPDTFVRACLHDTHVVRGDISVTQLIDAPQIRQLRRKHDVQEDVIDRIWMLMGTAVHHILELSEIKYVEARKLMDAYEICVKLGDKETAKAIEQIVKDNFPDAISSDVLLEQTLSVEIEGMVISGTMDKFTISTGRLEDYKNTKVYAYLNEESRKKWNAQLNIYAYMLRQHGYTVKEAEICAIFKDHTVMNVKRNKDYPPLPVTSIPVKLYDDEFMVNYLKKRVLLHRMADKDIQVDCNEKDRWSEGNKLAVMVPSRKRALKVDSPDVIQEWLKSNAYKYPKIYTEVRHGMNRRCEDYCSVRDVCPQYKKIKEQMVDKSEELEEQ
jgi:hypothetical protein